MLLQSLADPPKLGDVLGHGTVGAVYRSQLDDGTSIAVKVLSPNVSHDEKVKRRFEREMLILEKLKHPNIIRYHGGGKIDGQLYYAMELIDGGSLKQLLVRHRRFSWQQVVEWGIQICSALQHAHNHGIVHRDLKPGNLFLMRDGRLVLGDFGIALDTGEADLTGDGITVGTYAYMPPEQICAGQTITNQTDLYALGCVLYELLTGQPPYRGENFAQIWEQHLHAEIPDPRAEGVDAPDWLATMIMRLLEKDPQQRPFNARMVEGQFKQNRERMREEGMDVEVPGGSLSLLQEELPFQASQPADVSWLRLASLVLAAAAIVGAAWLINQR
ncbi:MAG: serine/threonine protein kinase [Planctomycetales bacterium]|nr:serine/threonine protein kinase [Planctomycetales bacterium]